MEHKESVHRDGASAFAEFTKNELKIIDPLRGLVPFELFDFQKELIESYEENRFVITRKFRNSGFTTTTLAYLFWKCSTTPDQNAGVFCCRTADAVGCFEVIRRMAAHCTNCEERFDFGDGEIFFKETNSKIVFRAMACSKGHALDYVLLDEAAFNFEMEDFWKSIYPTLSLGGKCFVVSATNGRKNRRNGEVRDNWFYQTFRNAFRGLIDFKVFDCEYTRHPCYSNQEYLENTKKALGDIGFRHEVLCQFVDLREADPIPTSCDISVKHVEVKDFNDCQKKSYENGGGEKSFPPNPDEETKAGLNKRLSRCTAGMNKVEHPDIPKDPGWTEEDLIEVWEDVAKHIPAYKSVAQSLRDRYGVKTESVSVIKKEPTISKGLCNDLCKLAGVNWEDCTPEEKKELTNSLHKRLVTEIVNDSLPKEMQITISERAVEINGVPTKISGKGVEYLFLGFMELENEEFAIKHTASLIRKKLKKLF